MMAPVAGRHITGDYMPLTPIALAATVDTQLRAVRFVMRDGSKIISILVSGPALENIEIGPAAQDGYFGTFKLYRKSFERIASGKYDKRHVESDGSVCIRAMDVRSASAD